MKTLSIAPCDAPTLIAGLSEWAMAHGARWDPLAGAAAGVVCLDSALTGSELGRWTLGAACPIAVATDHDGDPFKAVAQLMSDARLDPVATTLPFAGGAIGVWGYGCRAATEAMDWDPLRGGEPHAWWGFYDTFVAVDHDTGTATVASWGLEDPGARPDPVLAARRVQELARCIGEAEPRPADAEPLGLQPAISPGEHEDAVQAVLQDIRDGQYYQACLTYPMTAKRRGQTALDLFTTLRRLTPAPFAAFLATGTPLALAGASPERFLEVRSGLVRARPMKGTRPRGHDLITDQALSSQLRQSEKDRAENVMIVDLMRNDLGRVCELGSIRVPALFTVETYATVHQLTSTVVGRLRPDVPPWEVARACFPPGSMTGAPKIRAMERLAELEPHSRSWYSGVLGYIDVRGEMDLSVVIRTALVRENEVHWHVGGGIVADSTPAGEWGESLDKCPGGLRGQ